MSEQTIDQELAELEAAEITDNTAVISESADTDKGGNGKQTAAQRRATAAKGEVKPPKYYLPFGKPIFTRPDRLFEVQRTNRKGEKTGAVGTLMANITIPLMGGVVDLKISIWRDSQLNRETGMIDHTSSVSLPRNQFSTIDGQQHIVDEWRQGLLDAYKVWRDTDAAKLPGKRSNMTPRLVESSKPEPKPVTT